MENLYHVWGSRSTETSWAQGGQKDSFAECFYTYRRIYDQHIRQMKKHLGIAIFMMSVSSLFSQLKLPHVSLEKEYSSSLDLTQLSIEPEITIKLYDHVKLPSAHFPSLKPLALFCRLEHKADGRAQVKNRFRLGSTEHVDYLEGKHY